MLRIRSKFKSILLIKEVTNYYSKRDNSNKVNNKYSDTINVKVINYKANGNGKKKYIYL